MACEFEVILNAGIHSDAADLAVAALDRVDELEAQLTIYRDTSELAAINRQAATGPVAVEPRLFELFQLASRLNAETSGAFDVTAGPLTKAWGFFTRRGAVPDAATLERALASVGSQYLKLDEQQGTIEFARPDMELNLGAIGKGYALDRAAELLDAAGVTSYLLHGGQSSVLARGGQAGEGEATRHWTVGLGDPARPGRRLALIDLENQALATSGSRVQSFREGGRRYGHILDPRTGQPAQGGVLSSTVIAPSAAVADAVSTALFILGVEGASEFCQSHAEIGAVLVTPGKAARYEVHRFGIAETQVRLAPDGDANPRDGAP